MTRGISTMEYYYYRRLFIDALRAVEAAQSHPEVGATRVLLAGLSQGGGIAIATAGLAAGGLDGIVCTMADVPFLQDFSRGPYPEIASFLSRHRNRYKPALAVLNYFDGVHLGRRATAPALFSVAQMDDICPPSTGFAAYNAYGTGTAGYPQAPPSKAIEVYRFNNHEGGQDNGLLGLPEVPQPLQAGGTLWLKSVHGLQRSAGVSPFPTASIQSMASSEKWKPEVPFSPTHQAPEAAAPPASSISRSTFAGTASPLLSISQSRVEGFSFGHHCSILMAAVYFPRNVR